jgi:hypothetical protein
MPFVREVAAKGYYDGCRSISSELDVEIAISIERRSIHKPYLEIKRGRHRSGLVSTRGPNGELLSTLFDPAGNILAYDLEADVISVRAGQLRRESSMPGVIYTDHAIDAALLAYGIDQLADLNVADTYPKTITVTDEANLDRLSDDIKSARGA